MRLLLVEDNDDLAQLLVQGLERAGFDVDRAGDAVHAGLAVETVRYAAVVLDRGLPEGDGLDVVRRMRARRDSTPVLVLTARGGVEDRVTGLQAGADDYLLKPFAFEELTARLHALLRRPGDMVGEVLRVGRLALHTESRQVMLDETPQAFSGRELTLLEILMRRGGRVVQKKHVEDQLFGLDAEVGPNALEVQIHRLRKRLEALDAGAVIHTVRGVGYLMAAE
jgi:DNA-binding response OmpR family regulator